MYATLIPRRVYEKIGGFDTNFRGGPDDIDYCNRVVAAGGLLLCSLHVLTWHFGSVTIAESYPPDRWIFNIDYFKSKWGHFPVFVNQERYDAMKVRANALSDAGA
jgi:GT2 family glycosyltransferase